MEKSYTFLPLNKGGNVMQSTKVRIDRQIGGSLEEVVRELLPKKTGFVEVQYDVKDQEHPSHTHPTDEILHILEGSLTFTVEKETAICSAGDRIYLPKETLHGSKAGAFGCTYVIAILK